MGAGAEAEVFATKNGQALRVHREGTVEADLLLRVSLLARLSADEEHIGFQIPKIRDHGFEAGFYFTLEDRLPGKPMSDVMANCTSAHREILVQNYMDTSTQIPELLQDETQFGELALHDGIRRARFKDFLRERAKRSLAICGLDVDVEAIVAGIIEPDKPSLVHLDYCPSNVLCEDGKISAVLDFGGTTIAGSAYFNPIVATAFLNPMITKTAAVQDELLAMEWLKTNDLAKARPAATKWLAAYWSFCSQFEDQRLYNWCRTTLEAPPAR